MSHADYQRAALAELRDELSDAIDGGEECQGSDSQKTRWIELCDIALGNPVDPWAELFHAPSIRARMNKGAGDGTL